MDDSLDLLLSGQRYKKIRESFYSSVLKMYDLTMLDIRILMFFYEHKGFDTARDLVKTHYLTKSYVSKSIEKLIDRNFLLTKSHEKDKRCAHLAVCDKALPVINEVAKQRKRMLEELFCGISEEQKKALWEVAVLVNENAEKILHQDKIAQSGDFVRKTENA